MIIRRETYWKLQTEGRTNTYLLADGIRFPPVSPVSARKILYDTSNDLESVELAPSDRRALGRVDDDATRTAFEGRRLVFEDCAACEEAWDASCASASSVCDLVGFGSPFSAEAAASIDTTCETFGSACLSHNAVEACQGQCTNEGNTRHKRVCV